MAARPTRLVFTGGTLQAGGTITSPATRPVTATSTALIDTNGQAVSVAGIISGAGGLTKSGAGTLSLSGVNDYTGVTTLGAGTLSVGTIGNGGVSGNLARPPALPLTWCLTAARCNTPALRPVPTATSRLALSKTATVDVSTAASTLTISGAAAATNGALTKIGAGTLALGGTNLYTGATAVNDGTLLVNGSITSDTTVTSPATLGGTGTITGNVSGTGTVAPGASIETLQISGNYTPGGPTLIELQDPYTTAGTHYDQLIVSGTVNLGGGTLTLIASGAAAAAGTQMTIIDNTGSGAVTPFSGLADGATVSNGSYTGRISYFGGDGNDVVLSTLNTAASVVIGTASADTFQIRRVGSTIQVLLGGSVVFAAPLASLNSLQIDGGDGNDTLTINYVDDANSDGFFNLPITFNGQGPTTSPGDKLVISGGTFDTVTPNHTNANDGDINLDGTVITYTGLEPVDITGTTITNLVVNLTDTNDAIDDATELRISAGNLIVDSLNGEHEDDTIALTGITSITINGRAGDDTITLDATLSTFSGTLVVNGGTEADAVVVEAGVTLTGNANHSAALDLQGAPSP